MKNIPIVLLLLFFLLLGTGYGQVRYPVKGVWTGKEMFIFDREKAFAYSPEKDAWRIVKTPEFCKEPGDFKSGIHVLAMTLSKAGTVLIAYMTHKESIVCEFQPKDDSWKLCATVDREKLNEGSRWTGVHGIFEVEQGTFILISSPKKDNREIGKRPGKKKVIVTVCPERPFESFAAYKTDKRIFLWGMSIQRKRKTIGYVGDFKTWSKIPEAPSWSEERKRQLTPRAGFSHCESGGKILIYGGSLYGSGSMITGFDDGFLFSVKENRWYLLPTENGPGPAMQTPMCATKRGFFVMGEFGGALFDAEKKEWKRVPTKKSPRLRSRAICVNTGKEILIWGGVLRLTIPPTDGAAYNLAKDTWRPIPRLRGIR
jgi:hypothetical protein